MSEGDLPDDGDLSPASDKPDFVDYTLAYARMLEEKFEQEKRELAKRRAVRPKETDKKEASKLSSSNDVNPDSTFLPEIIFHKNPPSIQSNTLKSIEESTNQVSDDKPPKDARFFTEVSRRSIFEIECTNPFKGIKVFDISGVDKRPLTFDVVPEAYRPYQGCLFDVLSEPDDDKRFQNLKEYFRTAASPGDKGRETGLIYTVMHIWQLIFALQVETLRFEIPHVVSTLDYLIDAGMINFFTRILSYSLDRKFLLCEFNRYVPCRVLECLFASTHVEQPNNEKVVEKILEDKEKMVNIIYSILTGGISGIEQLICVQLVGNLTSYIDAVTWLLNNPKLCAAVAKHLWTAFNVQYKTFRQYEDMQCVHIKNLYTTYNVYLDGREQVFTSVPTHIPELSTYTAICLVVNICAAYPTDNPMYQIEPCILAIVEEGLHNHVGEIFTGILLNSDRNDEMTPEKFISFVSWSVFQPKCQQLVLEQLNRLPSSRHDNPFYFNRMSFTKTRSVVSFLITHAIWFDFDRGSHFSVLGVISLLRENDQVAMEVVRLAGDLLFDIAHSIDHVRLPEDSNPSPIKKSIMESLLRLGGYGYYTRDAEKVTPKKYQFEEPIPQCILDTKEFCDRYVKEQITPKTEKQRLVRCADTFKSEGNNFFLNKQYKAAIVCYTKALDTCPLTCTERRVTYYSNRAECYLKTHQPRRAISDCNKAIAQNPRTFKARWRRSQALQLINVKHLAALDLFTIARRGDDVAKNILGTEKLEMLRSEPQVLLDQSNFIDMTVKELGPTQYRGNLTRNYAWQTENVKLVSHIPPFTGTAYHNMFGMEEGDHHQ